jgi:hypothetical protein
MSRGTSPRPQHAYASYFDSGYLSRGLALIESLRANGDDSPVWVMCLDDETKTYLDSLGDPSIRTVVPADLEAVEPLLAPLRKSRSRMEFYFTCTPLLVRYVLNRLADPDAVAVYLDADLGFFDDPGLVFDALGTGSVGIIEHRYPHRLQKRLAKYGRFNVGWVGFRNDEAGRACLDWWAQSCLDWCSDTPENGKYADQGYLDSFPSQFDSVVVLQGAGLNLAPWNTGRHRLSAGESPSGTTKVVVDGHDRLVFFHFHGVKSRGNWHVTSQLIYRSPMGSVLRDHVYRPYLALLDAKSIVVSRSPLVSRLSIAKRGSGLRGLLFGLQRATVDRISIATGNAVKIEGER